LKVVRSALEVGGGALAGCALGLVLFFVFLGVNYETSVAIAAVVIMVVPLVVGFAVFSKTQWALFCIAMIFASYVTMAWLFNFVFALYGSF
jgi:uncharacterized membrane protein YgaE (UPF0421/DUF939 family)